MAQAEPVIQQLFDVPSIDSVARSKAAAAPATTASSAAPQTSHRPIAPTEGPASTVLPASPRPSYAGASAGAAGARSRPDFPLTPAQAVERFSHSLSAYERDEIHQYPQIYFLGPLARKIQGTDPHANNMGYDDDKGRYKCVKYDHLAYRYEVLKGLGKGSFGDVVKAYDHKTKSHYAVKIIRNERRFHKQGQIEIKILEMLKRQDPKHSHNIIHIQEYFMFRNHLCIAFDLLHGDLYGALKMTNFRGFPMPKIRELTSAVVSCLRVLRRSKIIHCDLKPENILLVSKDASDIRVIDFGSACLSHEKIHTYIQSRFYRAPEVILGASYGTPIDMWSLGCMIAEFHTGQPLFPGRDEKEQLMYQMEVLGVPPASFLSECKRASIFFDDAGTPRVTQDRKGRAHPPNTRSLATALQCSDEVFLDFVASCLKWDPLDRMTPHAASKHPFLHRQREAAMPRSVSVGSAGLVPGSSATPLAKQAVPTARINLACLETGEPGEGLEQPLAAAAAAAVGRRRQSLAQAAAAAASASLASATKTSSLAARPPLHPRSAPGSRISSASSRSSASSMSQHQQQQSRTLPGVLPVTREELPAIPAQPAAAAPRASMDRATSSGGASSSGSRLSLPSLAPIIKIQRSSQGALVGSSSNPTRR